MARRTGFICDQVVRPGGVNGATDFPDKPRRIKLRDPERGKTLVIREAPNDCQNSVLHDPETGRHHVIPFRPSAKAKVIHAKLGLDTSVRRYRMTTDGKGVNSA